MGKIPALKQLMTFEVAARHLSFTHAATELGVRQPAVSRQVAELESQLETALFVRSKPRLTLTYDGDALYAVLSDTLERIQSVVSEIRQRQQKNALIVNTPIGFTSCFLMRHLAAFEVAHSDIELALVTRDQNRAFDPRLCDVVIVFGEGDLPGVYQRQIFREELIAVCSPVWKKSFKRWPLTLPQLVKQPLLHLNTPSFCGDWQRYLEKTKARIPTPPSTRQFNSFMVYLQAALNGDGFALSLSHLMQERLNTGQLVLAHERRVSSHRGYYACVMARAEHKEAAYRFVDWASRLCE